MAFKEWRENTASLPTLEQQKELFAGLKWRHNFHMRSAESDVSTFRCDEIGLNKSQHTEHLDPQNQTGMYQLGKTITSYYLDGDARTFTSLAEVAGAILVKAEKANK